MKPFERRGRTKQLHLLSKAVQLEETMDLGLTRLAMLSGALIVFMFVGWSAIAELNQLSRTSGTIEPLGQERVVQHPDGGVIKRVLVHEGQQVKAGQVMVTLIDHDLNKDISRATARLQLLKIEEIRLRAYLDDTSPDYQVIGSGFDLAIADSVATYRSQVEAREDRINVALLQREELLTDLAVLRDQLGALTVRADTAQSNLATNETLFKSGLITTPRLRDARDTVGRTQSEVNIVNERIAARERTIAEFSTRIDAIHSEDRAQNFLDLTAILAQVGETTELVEKLQDQLARLVIRAPVDGIIKGLQLVEPGEIVPSARTIAKIVPVDEALVARIRVAPSEIGNLSLGLPVQVKVSAFDFGRYGAIDGRLTRLSPGTFRDESGQYYYAGEIELAQNYVGDDPENGKISSGMQVSADIVTGSKSILQYLMEPVFASLSVALTES